MDTRAVGDAAEAAILNAFTQAGLLVWMPWSRFGPSDLMVETPDDLFRVQVKSGRVRRGCVLANARSTDHGQGRRSYDGLIDIIAVHVPEIDRQFVVPVEQCNFEIRLRLTPTLNSQAAGVRWAADHRLEDWAARALLAAHAGVGAD